MKLGILFSLVLALATLQTSAQLSSFDFNDETKVKFNVRYGSINTFGASPDSVINPKAVLLRVFEFDHIKDGVGGYNASHRWAFIPETFILAVIDGLNGGDFTWGSRTASSNIGDFILGWHNHAWNVVYTDKFGVGVGFHWGDYFTGYDPYDPLNKKFLNATEPAGWYGALGPALLLDYNLFDLAVLHVEGAYGFSLKFRDYPDMRTIENYPSPNFINITAQIRTNTVFYGGMEYVRSIDRGTQNISISRTDFFIGIWI